MQCSRLACRLAGYLHAHMQLLTALLLAAADFMAIMVIGPYFFWNVWLNAMLAIFMRLNKQDAVSH